VRQAEERLLGWPGLETIYTRVGSGGGAGSDTAADVIGTIQYEFVDWRERKNANAILADLRVAMGGIPGADIEVSVPDAGPPTGKAIQIRMSADDPTGLNDAARLISEKLAGISDVTDIDAGLPLPGVDWELQVDRGEASRYGASPGAVGAVVQLVTSGLKLSDFRPAGSDDAVDIVLRLPSDQRTISALDQLRIETELGPVPISNFVTRVAAPTTGTLTRIDGARTVTVQAGIREGVQAQQVRDTVTAMLNQTFTTEGFTDSGIRWTMVGEDQEQAEAGAFLSKAFGAAIFLIFVVLLAQFNKFISVGLVLSAVIMSTIGVFLGLMIMGQPFGIVMSGIGVIALAGVVVNNNIVLIATYDQLRDEGMAKIDAILETCRERARPVVLTALTAIFGVLPIAFGLNLELLNHETTFGAPSTQWWISLSSAIVFGLAFATILTLLVTPSMLMLVTRGDGQRAQRRSWFRRKPKDGPIVSATKRGQPAE
jgi:multidrug efflux pump